MEGEADRKRKRRSYEEGKEIEGGGVIRRGRR